MSLVPTAPLATAEDQPSPWSPLVICMIASLSTVFLIFSYYTIIRIIRIKLGARSFRNRVQRNLLINEAIIEYPIFQYQSHGLDDSMAQSLPIIQYLKDENQPRPNLKNTDCAVCLGEFQDGEQLKFLPKCSHSFHISCIDKWFMSHSNCPLCRNQVFELSISTECSVSMDILLETLGRENYVHSQERDEHYQNLRSEILRNHAP